MMVQLTKLLGFFFCNFVQLPTILSSLGSLVPLTTSFSVRCRVPHQYKTEGKIAVLQALIVTTLCTRREDQRFGGPCGTLLPQFSLLLLFP
jgi:hypothetical protein